MLQVPTEMHLLTRDSSVDSVTFFILPELCEITFVGLVIVDVVPSGMNGGLRLCTCKKKRIIDIMTVYSQILWKSEKEIKEVILI